jgi:glycosyltransferase involved in cell wall biosynthesis
VIPYKKFDLVVEAFNKNGKKLIICVNTKNKLQKYLEKISKPNITWIFDSKKEDLRRYYSEARAFLFPPEEDF